MDGEESMPRTLLAPIGEHAGGQALAAGDIEDLSAREARDEAKQAGEGCLMRTAAARPASRHTRMR
jgi:hypothetical protein